MKSKSVQDVTEQPKRVARGSLRRMVSPWIRAALVRDAGRLGLRGQRDARSIAEKSFKKVHFIVDGNNSRCEYPRMNKAIIKMNCDAHTWTPETRFSVSFMHNGFFHQSFHASIAEAQMEAARFGMEARLS